MLGWGAPNLCQAMPGAPTPLKGANHESESADARRDKKRLLGGIPHGKLEWSYLIVHSAAIRNYTERRCAPLSTVLATTNVAEPSASWEVLGAPVPVGNGLYQFTDAGTTNHVRRFYQLRSP